MNEYDDRRLAALLSEAVDDLEPTESLDAIRERTRVTPISSRRPWLFATGGAVLATAAAVTAVALATGSLSGPTADPPPGESGSPTEAVDPTPTDGATNVVPVYLVGETPSGARLYREFVSTSAAEDELEAAVRLSVEGGGTDPDYRTLWPAGVTVGFVEFNEDEIGVSLEGAPPDLPAGMSPDDAALAVQQVIYTAQAAVGQGRLPVQILVDADPADTVLGQPASEALPNAPVIEVLAQVSLTTPTEGAVEPDGTLRVEGVANSYEATVLWSLERVGDGEVVAEGFFNADGWMDKLYPFEGEIDLAGIPPGAYLLTISESDPSGGEEGTGPDTDTRTITIE
jgi:hypothetical protein